jgi:hypothetical protein
MRTASEELLDMILKKSSAETLCAGAELGVFDYMSQDKARAVAEVAAQIDMDPAILYRLLRGIASLGLLNETPERGFILTERGALLRTVAAGSLRYLAMLQGGVEHRAIWECVPAEIKNGGQNEFLSGLGSGISADRSDLHPKELQDQVSPTRIKLRSFYQAKEKGSGKTKNEHSG